MSQATKRSLSFFSEAELFMQIGQNTKRHGNKNPHTHTQRDTTGMKETERERERERGTVNESRETVSI